jgi:hypothetical protein
MEILRRNLEVVKFYKAGTDPILFFLVVLGFEPQDFVLVM